MSSLERLLKKFVSAQDRITIDDVERLLNQFGYEKRRNPGSHNVFHKMGAYPITVPTAKGKYIKKQYIKRLVKILGLEDELEKLQGD